MHIQFKFQLVFIGLHCGLWCCGIGQFFVRYFGNFNLELRYCGIFQTCGTGFLCVLVDDSFYRPFLAVSGHFGSILKQRFFLTHFTLQFECVFFTTSLKPCHCFQLPTARFCLFFLSLALTNPPSYTGFL